MAKSFIHVRPVEAVLMKRWSAEGERQSEIAALPGRSSTAVYTARGPAHVLRMAQYVFHEVRQYRHPAAYFGLRGVTGRRQIGLECYVFYM